MSTSNEKTIEDAIVATFSGFQVVADKEAVVMNWADQNKLRDGRNIVVHVSPATRLQPNSDYYRMRCDAMSITSMHKADDDDADGTARDELYQVIWAWMNSITAAQLSTITGLTIDGIVPTEGEDSSVDEWGIRSPSMDIFATLTATAPVTTTTTTTTTT